MGGGGGGGGAAGTRVGEGVAAVAFGQLTRRAPALYSRAQLSVNLQCTQLLFD